jgi:phage replication O-like protein O
MALPANLNEIRERKMSEENNSSETFTKVPNAFLDNHLNKITHLPELKITLAIIRKTIGYGKRSDIISYSQFEEMTGMTRPSVCDGINLL